MEDATKLIHGMAEDIHSLGEAISLRGTRQRVNSITVSPLDSIMPPVKVAKQEDIITESGVSDAETLQYQIDSIVDEMTVLEAHLAAGGKIAGKACDCLAKHSRLIKKLAVESIPIASRQGKNTEIYTQLAAWAKSIQDIGSKEAVESGQYTERYPKESGNCSKLRKAVDAGKPCTTCGGPKRLPDFMKSKGG
jgi:hypothetical protein